jgi:hypothetical protein
MTLCEYRDIFGKPNTGAHSLRVGGLAAVDLLATGGAAYLVSRYALGRTDYQALIGVFIVLIIIAIFMHRAFCVDTTLNVRLFGRLGDQEIERYKPYP